MTARHLDTLYEKMIGEGTSKLGVRQFHAVMRRAVGLSKYGVGWIGAKKALTRWLSPDEVKEILTQQPRSPNSLPPVSLLELSPQLHVGRLLPFGGRIVIWIGMHF